jgi:biotin operon repressor
MRPQNKQYPKKLLQVLRESEKDLCLSEIARRVGITRFTAMQVIARLNEKGCFFEERRTPRYRYITLSQEMEEILNKNDSK